MSTKPVRPHRASLRPQQSVGDAVGMGMCETPRAIDFGFQPSTYWTVPDEVYARVKDVRQRRRLRAGIDGDTVDALPAGPLRGEVPALILALLRNQVPSLLHGETLPECGSGEVEIARVTYRDTTLGDVVSFRARPDPHGIRYRAVTDNADDLPCEQKLSDRPLRMSQVIRLIDRAGQATVYWSRQMRCGVARSDLPSFVVESIFYLQLKDFYQERAERWMQRNRVSEVDPGRLATVRRNLLDNLRWEERTRGIRRSDATREALADRYLRLRFSR